MEKKSSGRLICAAPEFCADLLYAGGFNAPDPIVWFRTGEFQAIVVSILEFERATLQAGKNVRILPLEEFFTKDDKLKTDDLLIRRISGKYGISSWEVPEDFPVFIADQLRKNGIEVLPEPDFFPERECKKSAEIKKIARAMSVTQEAMMLAKEMIQQSVIRKNMMLYYGKKVLTSEWMRMEIEGFLKARGFTASRTITAHGTQCSQPHNIGSGPILAGETVVVDIFPRDDETGYWGDMTRTFVKGEPLPVVKRAYEAVLAASQEAEKMIRAGVIAADVHNKAKEIMANAGFKTGKTTDGIPCGFIHGLGHGVGLEIHEAPRVSPANKAPLKKGQVISNEPGLYHPSWGGIRLEDVLAVTENGSRNFYIMPKDMIV